jgi:hypothetical protein
LIARQIGELPSCLNQPKRTWVIAPDAESLEQRWQTLISAPAEKKEELFHATLRDGIPADRHIRSVVKEALPSFPPNHTPLIKETGPCLAPVRYAFRSFNRQWIIPDLRVITQPNAALWASRSERQIFLTALSRTSPENGPALTFTSLVPDLDHYNGRGGRVFPLWRDDEASIPNIPPKLLSLLSTRYGSTVLAEDFISYIAAAAAHPAFTAKFQDDLSTPGLRIPITADGATFAEAAELGSTLIWLHTFGARMSDPDKGRPAQPPRLVKARMPSIPASGAIPQDPDSMPDTIDYDGAKKRLLIGSGYIEKVEPAVWHYQVSGKQVLLQWFSYRKRHRERPIIGDRRAPSPLGNIQPDHWLAEYTTELLNVLNVLSLLVELEPAQAALLEKICAGPTVTSEELRGAAVYERTAEGSRSSRVAEQPELFSA